MRVTPKRLRILSGLCVALAWLALALSPAGLLSGWLTPSALAATTFVVNSTGDGGDSNTGDGVCNDGTGNCTLRAAIQQANVTPGTDTIAFNIPGSGVRTIAPATGLPVVSDRIVIDGYTQPGSSPNTLAVGNDAVLLVELSGANINTSSGTGAAGLVLSNGNHVVRGLVINRFVLGSGISVELFGDCLIEGNYIGTDATGTSALGNFEGVKITANSSTNSNNLIGGTTPAARNVISGNGVNGVLIERTASGNRVQGNYIGTNAAGTAALGNRSHGVYVGTTFNTVGGTTAAARNIISGNSQAGVMVQPSTGGSAQNAVQGNYIGTDATGAYAVPNFFGVWLNFGTGNTIGGTTPAAGNVISGNTASGVLVTDSDNNVISSNLIGTGPDAVRPLGNGRHGVEIGPFSRNNRVHPQGPDAAGNTIAFNAESGVALIGPPNSNTDIVLNSIFSNGDLGIDMFPPGVTPNDEGVDDGINTPQNFPLITAVNTSAASTVVQGTLSSKPSTSYTLAFYSNAGCDSSGHGEGARPMGLRGVTTDTAGNASFSFTFVPPVAAARVITATARGPHGVSEFSPCSAGAAAGQVEFLTTSYSAIEDAGGINVTVVRTGGSAGPLTINIGTSGTAVSGADYTVPSTLIFADGETTKTFLIQVVSDGVTEPDEIARLFLFDPTNPEAVGPRATFTLNILDASKQPAVSVNDLNITEPLSGTTPATFTLTLSAATGRTVSVDYSTADQTATAGLDYQAASGTVTFGPDEVSKTITVLVNGDVQLETDESFLVNLSNPFNATVADAQGVGLIVDNKTTVLEFSAADFRANEGDHAVVITVSRNNRLTAGTFTIDYATADGTASERKDYTTALGTLRFAPGETTKSFTVLLTDDGFQESDETVNLVLSNPTNGAALAGQSTAVLVIADNDPSPSATNPIDDTEFFVRQHYHDFLNREPDAAGLAFWRGGIEACGADQQCRQVKRIDTSAAFFLSIEFQDTGFFVHRVYRASFDRLPRFREFLRDTQEIGRGVVVGQGNWVQQLEQKRAAFVAEFVNRAEFRTAYPDSLTAAQFVDELNAHTGGSLSQGERDALVAGLEGGTQTRATVLRAVTEDDDFEAREKSPAFVLIQYFGYLRRNPDDPPDSDLRGYNFWLDKLNDNGGDFRRAEMVRSFLDSFEYRERFR